MNNVIINEVSETAQATILMMIVANLSFYNDGKWYHDWTRTYQVDVSKPVTAQIKEFVWSEFRTPEHPTRCDRREVLCYGYKFLT